MLVLARVRTATSFAPALISTLEHSVTVAPVVITSSTRSSRSPCMFPFTAKAFFRFNNLSLADNPIWGGVSFIFRRLSIRRGTFSFFDITLEMRRDWLKPLSLRLLILNGTGIMPKFAPVG